MTHQTKIIYTNPSRGMGFSGDSDGKEFACNVGDLGSVPEL